MFNGYDFIYDGKSSISENLKMLYTDVDVFSSVKSIPDKEFSLFKTNQSSRWNLSGITMSEPLSFPIEIIMHSDDIDFYANGSPVLERNRLSKIRHWLFDKTKFAKLQILTDDMRDMYFMAIFKDVEDIEAGGDVYGFKATVLCDTTGAYEEKNITKTSSGSLTFPIQCLQDGIYEVMPTYIINMIDSDVTIKVNGIDMIINSVTPGSTITIDTEKLIAKSSEGDNLYTNNRFNRVFPTFVFGRNIISVDGKCKLTVNYKMVREVGC